MLDNIGDLAKPATTLIEKIANAGYILYEPRHIKKIATAKAQAAVIEAESQIEITDLHRRAALRWVEEEAQHQKNMEDITIKAAHQLSEDADPHAIDNDWIAKFFDITRLVSDDEMQNIWANILAGEANSVESYSPKSLTTLANMSKRDINLFSEFCSLSIVQVDIEKFYSNQSNPKIKSAVVPIIVSDMSTEISYQRSFPSIYEASQEYFKICMKYNAFWRDGLQLLMHQGLITDITNQYCSHFLYNNNFYLLYSKEGHTFSYPVSGRYLSNTGCELFSMVELNRPDDYFEAVNDYFTHSDMVQIKSLGIEKKL